MGTQLGAGGCQLIRQHEAFDRFTDESLSVGPEMSLVLYHPC